MRAWILALSVVVCGGLMSCGGAAPQPELTLIEVLGSEVEYPALSRSSYWEVQRHAYSQEWRRALMLCEGWSDRPNCQPVLDLEVRP